MVSMLCIRITQPGKEKALGSRTLKNSVVPYPTIANDSACIRYTWNIRAMRGEL
jgi:hypothetical protein